MFVWVGLESFCERRGRAEKSYVPSAGGGGQCLSCLCGLPFLPTLAVKKGLTLEKRRSCSPDEKKCRRWSLGGSMAVASPSMSSEGARLGWGRAWDGSLGSGAPSTRPWSPVPPGTLARTTPRQVSLAMEECSILSSHLTGKAQHPRSHTHTKACSHSLLSLTTDI